ncbi:thioredoxin domain-containing protein [Salegentibacter sediminis]|uniref:hypothetical protein n=1 Tax=Salegentibacter sediminis TaxID=1930251 RepID=UPI0012FF6A22|nr:hypothetical protein [Salegentibacter sediminis]
MNRLCIYSHDVAQIMGISLKSAQKKLRLIRTHYHKEKHQCVTIDEFCEFTGLNTLRVYNEINRINSYTATPGKSRVSKGIYQTQFPDNS